MTLIQKSLQRDWIEGISGTDFTSRVQACCSQLEALSSEAQARGALITETDPVRFAAAFFAAVSLDVPVILANPNWGTQEWVELATLVQPTISFRRGVTYDALSAVGSVSAGVISDAPTLKPGRILIPTGGTTGGVKLAVHTWASLEAACHGVQDFLGSGAVDSCCVLPLYHVSGLMQLLRAYHTGGRIRFDENEIEGRCLSYVPTQLQRAMTDPERIRKIAAARVIFVGGAGMPESVATRARELKLPVVPVYGMTETAAMVAAVPNQDFLDDPQAGAVPLGEARFAIVDGQIRVQTPALFRGYQGCPAADFSQGYLTGDRGRLDAAGGLHVLGRMDRLINTGGEKVDPREVEAALLEIEGIAEARVFGKPDPEWGRIVVASIEADPGLDLDTVRARLKTKLSPHKIPKRFQCSR